MLLIQCHPLVLFFPHLLDSILALRLGSLVQILLLRGSRIQMVLVRSTLVLEVRYLFVSVLKLLFRSLESFLKPHAIIFQLQNPSFLTVTLFSETGQLFLLFSKVTFKIGDLLVLLSPFSR